MRYDGELQLAFRRIAETRKQLEENGNVERLEQLLNELEIVNYTVQASICRARGLQMRLLADAS